jgi:hypothetical protein
MAQTLAHLLTHTIFNTKNREPLGDLNPGRKPWEEGGRTNQGPQGRKTLAQGVRDCVITSL